MATESGAPKPHLAYTDQSKCAQLLSSPRTGMLISVVQNLSHDPVRNEANANDPRIIHKGSLRVLNDMLTGVSARAFIPPGASLTGVSQGEELLWNDYRRWPRSLPVCQFGF